MKALLSRRWPWMVALVLAASGATIAARRLSRDRSAASAPRAAPRILSLHAELAVDYLSLRAQDSLQRLLDDTVAAFTRSYELTKIRHAGGVASDEDVALAESQLKQTIAQATDVGVLRAQYEHAIAMLVGKAASSFSIAPAPLRVNFPEVPLGVPSQLLERRPDIAAAERRVAEANARIGIQRAAWFPTLTLSAQGGLASDALSSLFSWPSRIWALGASLAETLFDGGKRAAQLEQAMASYDAFAASY